LGYGVWPGGKIGGENERRTCYPPFRLSVGRAHGPMGRKASSGADFKGHYAKFAYPHRPELDACETISQSLPGGWPDGPPARWPSGPMALRPDGPPARWPSGPMTLPPAPIQVSSCRRWNEGRQGRRALGQAGARAGGRSGRRALGQAGSIAGLCKPGGGVGGGTSSRPRGSEDAYTPVTRGF